MYAMTIIFRLTEAANPFFPHEKLAVSEKLQIFLSPAEKTKKKVGRKQCGRIIYSRPAFVKNSSSFKIYDVQRKNERPESRRCNPL